MGAPRPFRKLAKRLLAVMLGLFLSTPAIGAWTCWRVSNADWRETCDQCGLVREVKRRGQSWLRTAPHVSPGGPEPTVACTDHDWIKSGWGMLDGVWVHLGPVSWTL